MTLALRTRLTILYAAIFGLLLLGLSIASYRLLARQLDMDATARLIELTDGLHGYLRVEHGSIAVEADGEDPDQAAFIQEATRYYQIYDANTGALIVQSSALEPFGLRFTPGEVRAFQDEPRVEDFTTDYGTIRVSNSVIARAGSKFLLQVGVSLESVRRALNAFLRMLLIGVPLASLAAMAAGRWMSGFALAPLARFAAATRTIDVSNLRHRLPVRGTGDELDEVAKGFNDTLDRLERAVGEMRQFSTALAHELRTPLAALRGEIELALRQQPSDGAVARSLASQLEEIDKLKHMIAQMLMLARAEAGDIQLARTAVDLDALAASLVEQLEPIAAAKSLALRVERNGAMPVDGDAKWLERLVLNLVDNAIKFTPGGGAVTVGLLRDDGHVVLRVSDTGGGIEAEALPHIFKPFFRADPARSPASEGVGLGLSLVKWIVDRHGGQIAVESQPGAGSTFSVRLPLINEN